MSDVTRPEVGKNRIAQHLVRAQIGMMNNYEMKNDQRPERVPLDKRSAKYQTHKD